jgi:hypothetical protein
LLHSIKDGQSEVTEVSIRWHFMGEFVITPDVSLAEDDNVVSTSEGIVEESNGLEMDLRVVGRTLIARTTIIIPFWDIFKGFCRGKEGL